MLERKQGTKKINIQQRSDTQPFPHPNHMCMYMSTVLSYGEIQTFSRLFSFLRQIFTCIAMHICLYRANSKKG